MCQTTGNVGFRPLRSMVATIILFVVTGCGSAEYQLRLMETRKYFEHLKKIEDSLSSGTWKDPKFDISMRLPRQFRELPGPPQDSANNEAEDSDGGGEASGSNEESDDNREVEGENNRDGERESGDRRENNEERANDRESRRRSAPVVDPRQPAFLDAPLPGLRAAWEANVEVEASSRDIEYRPAFLFLFSNHQLFLDREKDETANPLEFRGQFERALARGFQIDAPSTTSPWPWEKISVPSRPEYVRSKDFRRVQFAPETEFEGVRYNVIVYEYNVRDVVVYLLQFSPKKVNDRSEKLEERMEFALQTLEVSSSIPSTKSDAPKRTGGPDF